MQERLDALEKQNAELTAKAHIVAPVVTTATVKPVTGRGGVWVDQWRTTSVSGETIKIDKQKQYYDSDKFDQLNAKDDRGRSGFENLGISYKITEDLRNK